jgi:hypothetical protein
VIAARLSLEPLEKLEITRPVPKLSDLGGCHFEEASPDEKSYTMDTHPTDFSLPLEMTSGTTTYGDDSDGIAQIGP